MNRRRGYLDLARLDRIDGWAASDASSDGPVTLRIFDNGVMIGRAIADQFRPDLKKLGIGDGMHGFSFVLSSPLTADIRHVISVRREDDGSKLAGSPLVIEPMRSADDERNFHAASAPNSAAAPRGSLRGFLETARRDYVEGWVWDPQIPDYALTVRVIVNGAVIARARANRFRPDLADAGIGDGRHAFQIKLPSSLSLLSSHSVRVLNDSDGRELEDSPRVIEAADSFNGTLETAIDNAISALIEPDEQARVLAFLMNQADRLLQLKADSESQREERVAYHRFRRRWSGLAGETGDPTAAVTDPGLRALIIDDEYPDTERDAGSQAIISHVRSLQGLGYKVSFVAAHDLADRQADVPTLKEMDVEYYQAPFYVTVEEVLSRQARSFDLIYVHRISNASKYLAIARDLHPRARILYSVADLMHLRLARQAEVENRPELLAKSRRTRLAECTASWQADAVLTHSSHEARVLSQAVPDASVFVVPWTVVPRPTMARFAKRQGIAFIGSYSHEPNVDAAHFLAEDIMPLVWQSQPNIECFLVGTRMPPSVKSLAREGISIVSDIADINRLLEKIRLTVAPLRYGAGVKGKVLTSLAAGVPCIMTPVATEGIDLPNSLKSIVGNSAEELARLIIGLYRNRHTWRKISNDSISLIEEKFSAEVIKEALSTAIRSR